MHGDQLILEARQIGRRPAGATQWLLRDVSLGVRAGDRLAIVGPSGAGKTLLLRALAMIDPLDTGSLLWKGRPVSGSAVPAFRSRVMYLQQRPALVDGTVEDNLQRPFQLGVHRHRRFSREWAVAMLGALGRDPTFLAKRHHDLSGGETQVVALVRAFQLDPEVVLLDEPTASLDAATTQAAEGWLVRWLNERPATRAQLWVTHDPDQACRVAARAVPITAGRLA